MTSSEAPISSAITPKLLIRAMILTPEHVDHGAEEDQDRAEQQRVVRPAGGEVDSPRQRSEPRIWKIFGETCGSTTCHATATAATVTIEPTT